MKTTITILFVLILSFTTFAQTATPTPPKTISDAKTSDISDLGLSEVEMSISGTFAERKVTGKVVGVHDGDTATVLDADKRQYKFRFNGIDFCPNSRWISGKSRNRIYPTGYSARK